MHHWTDWLRDHLLSCPSVKYLHLQCPGCGMQRSLLLLFEGNFVESLKMHPAAILILVMAVFLPLHLAFKFRKGPVILIGLQVGIAVLSLGLYVYKIIHHQIFV